MTRRENWIKLHASDNDTAAIIRLSSATRDMFRMLQLYTVAHCDTGGVVSRNKRPIAFADIALELHTTEAEVRQAVGELLEAPGVIDGYPLLEDRRGILVFPWWNKRQSGNAQSKREKWTVDKRGQRARKGEDGPEEPPERGGLRLQK